MIALIVGGHPFRVPAGTLERRPTARHAPRRGEAASRTPWAISARWGDLRACGESCPADLVRRLPIVQRYWEWCMPSPSSPSCRVTRLRHRGSSRHPGVALASAPARGWPVYCARIGSTSGLAHAWSACPLHPLAPVCSGLPSASSDEHPEVGPLPAVVPGSVDPQAQRLGLILELMPVQRRTSIDQGS